MMRKKLTAATAAMTAALALALTGCSGAEPTAAPGGPAPETTQEAGAFNDADVMFAQGMVPHHQQAVEMSDLLLAKDGVDDRVMSLAEDIKAAQQPEIEQMNGWLETWGAETGGGMDHGEMGHDMGGGMMSEQDMADLEAAPGGEASSLFLEQMIRHHEGAVEMAQQEVEQGQSPEAVALAETIVTDQQAEIEEMRALLDTL